MYKLENPAYGRQATNSSELVTPESPKHEAMHTAGRLRPYRIRSYFTFCPDPHRPHGGSRSSISSSVTVQFLHETHRYVPLPGFSPMSYNLPDISPLLRTKARANQASESGITALFVAIGPISNNERVCQDRRIPPALAGSSMHAER